MNVFYKVFDKIFDIVKLYWNDWLFWPAYQIKKQTGINLTADPLNLIYKIAVTVVLILVIYELVTNFRHRLLQGFRSIFRRREPLQSFDNGSRIPRNSQSPETIEDSQSFGKKLKKLEKDRDYQAIAAHYVSLNQPKDAAKWYEKAKNLKCAAEQWAKAGHTIKAADLLMQAQDYDTAAHFYTEKNEHFQAAQAYRKANHFHNAATSFLKADKYAEAAKAFLDYFKTSNLQHSITATAAEVRAAIAEAETCLAMVESEEGRTAIPTPSRLEILSALADRFAFAKRYDTAARLYHEAENWVRAGETYSQAGKLEDAVTCFNAAGKTKEANHAAAQFYEKAGKWTEAAEAYGQAGDWKKAGDCFMKAYDAQAASECYEKAGEAYQAGLAHSRLGHFDKAILHLQKVNEADENFDQARGLLGRCFYELHDYTHCVAALENHLMNKAVDSTNLDGFYTLALAYEGLGSLSKSLDIHYKIHSLNSDYRDVSEKITTLSSRIASEKDATVPSPPHDPNTDTVEAHVMGMVENLLGGRYRLDREIGRGGMGTVYLAFDTQLDRPVALKFLGTLTDGSDAYRNRFIREAKAAARVSHANIISIYDIGASQGKAYIAMEYVEGTNLHTYIHQKNGLPPREAINIIAQVCAALNAVHKAGIIHRDIKPENILITQGGLAKLMDFGLAKADERITRTNVVMGTPSYMSPEQTRDSNVDERSDIYSVGLVLHEALTGRIAFTPGEDVLKRQQQDTPKPPGEIVDGIPETLNAIVMKCIEKKVEDRYQSAEELLADLRKVTL